MKEQRKSTREHEGREGEQAGASGSNGGASGSRGRAEEEQMDETGDSAGAKRRGMSQHSVTGCPKFGDIIYIYIYPPSPRLNTSSTAVRSNGYGK